MQLPLLITLGEWIADNAVAIGIPFLMGMVGVIIWLIRLENAVTGTVKIVDELSEDYYKHAGDASLHVNHMYMQSLKEDIIKLEIRIDNATEKLGGKLDHLAEQLYRK